MAIKILRQETHDVAVPDRLLIDTVERNRDRIRTNANMTLTISGVLISACLALLIFAADKNIGGLYLRVSFCIACLFFFSSTCLSVYSCTLRMRFSISGQAQFTQDLLTIYYRELSLLRASYIPLTLGFLTLTASMIIFLIRSWR
jgi:hypothetical protein